MLRDIIKDGGIYTLANLLTKGMTLLLLPFYARELSTAEFGILGILGVFGLFVTSVLCLQLNQGLGRYVAEPTNQVEKKRLIASTAIILVTVIYLFACILIIFFPDVFIDLLSADVVIPLKTFKLAVASIALTGVFYFVGVYMRFLRRPKPVAVISFSHALISTLLILLFVIHYKMGVDGVYLASIIVTPFAILCQLIVLRGELIAKFNLKVLKPLFTYSIPLVPGAISYVILNFTDRLFIKEVSMADAGIYEMGSKFTQIITIIVLGISSALGPIVYEKHLNENTKNELARIFRLFISAGCVGVLALSLFSMEALVVFTTEKYYPAAEIMPILYLATFFTGFSMFSIGLHIKEKTKVIGVVVVISAMLNIVLNYILIEKYQIAGAAVATLISVCFNNFILFFVSQRYYRLEFPFRKLFLALSILILLIYVGNVELPKLVIGPIALIFTKITLVVLFICYLYFSKLINFMKPINLIKK